MFRLIRIIFIFLFLSSILAQPVCAASKASQVKKGNKHYLEGSYKDSTQFYEDALKKDPQSPIINYNLGTSLYKEKKYDKAAERLQKTLLSEEDPLKLKAYYNFGNALYKSGIAKENTDIDFAISQLEKSLVSYGKVLAKDSEDADAKFNYEFVKKELERLKKNKETQKKQDQNQNQKDNKDQQKDQQKQQKDQQQNQEQNNQNQDQSKQDQQDNQNRQDQKQDQQENQQDQKDDSSKDKNQDQDNQDKNKDSSDKNDDKKDQQDQKQDNQKNDPSEPNEDQQKPEDSRGKGNGELSEQEAQMMLDDYRNNEEPQGLLNFIKRSGKSEAVGKDW